MHPTVLISIYCVLILFASLIGGWVPFMVRFTHKRIQLCVSLVAGLMLGVAMLHLLPHALLEAPGKQTAIFGWALAGFLVMFFIERFFCYHHHEVPETEEASHADCGHHSTADATHHGEEAHRLTWSGAAVGLTLHTVLAGIALAASVRVEETAGQGTAVLAGLGTFLVIFLHKPFDSMTITTLMTVGGWSRASRHLVNALFALMIPVGVLLFHLGVGGSHDTGLVAVYALAFSAGTFLCISMSDLLPELQFHSHDRLALSAALLVGLGIACAIGLVESGCHHDHAAPAGVEDDGGQPCGHEH